MTDKQDFMKRKNLPSLADFDEHGYSAVSLSLSLLKESYWHGYFPWPDDSDSQKIPFAHPRGRGGILIDEFHIPHTVKRILKNGPFELRIDTCFNEVLKACSIRPDEGTWITPEIQRAYAEFHQAGWAHSFEAWNRETGALAGGLYGVSIGKVFAGESMFFRESGASKYALACLGLVLKELECKLIDTQMVTSVTEQFGAKYYYRESYLEALEHWRNLPLTTEQLRKASEYLKRSGTIC